MTRQTTGSKWKDVATSECPMARPRISVPGLSDKIACGLSEQKGTPLSQMTHELCPRVNNDGKRPSMTD